MGQDQGTERTEVTDTRDPEQIQSEIEATREQLGDTVEALAQKADVKAQAKERIETTKASVSEKREQLLGKAKESSPESATVAVSQVSQKARQNPLPIAATAAFVVGFLAGRLTGR